MVPEHAHIYLSLTGLMLVPLMIYFDQNDNLKKNPKKPNLLCLLTTNLTILTDYYYSRLIENHNIL